MFRASLTSVILLFAVSDAYVTFKDSFVISHQDFDRKTFKLTIPTNQPWLLYGVSAGSDAFNERVVIEAVNSDNQLMGMKLDTLVKKVDNGKLQPFKINAGYNQFTIFINTTEATPSMTFYLLKNKTPATHAPPVVFHASSGNNLRASSDDSFLVTAATFLSAASYFTLSDFDIGGTGIVNVFPSGWDAVDNKEKVDSVLMVKSAEFASRSFVTIFGPIATVSVTRLLSSKFSVSVDNAKWMSSTFGAGAAFSAVSPGFISFENDQKYPSLYNEDIKFDWTVNTKREVPLTIKVKTNILPDILRITTYSADAKSNKTYQQVTDTSVMATANEIKVTYDFKPTAPRPLFLVQVTSSGTFLSIGSLVAAAAMLISWM